ncbi:general transcription factor 3C polypeptide 6 [Mantella aurantiaca]
MSSKSVVVNPNAKQASIQSEGVPAQDSEDEYEEEEHLVSVELTGIIDSDILEKCNNRCKILGINTEKPFLQVDKYVFAGEYEDALGTCVIFEEPLEHGEGDNAKPKLKYKCHTVKKLNMTRTFLTEKKDGDDGGGKIEWFQIKEDSNASWSQMICSFAQENEEAEESEGEEKGERPGEEPLDGPAQDGGQAEQSVQPGIWDCDGKGESRLDCEGRAVKEEPHAHNDDRDGGTGRSSPAAQQGAEDSECAKACRHHTS